MSLILLISLLFVISSTEYIVVSDFVMSSRNNRKTQNYVYLFGVFLFILYSILVIFRSEKVPDTLLYIDYIESGSFYNNYDKGFSLLISIFEILKINNGRIFFVFVYLISILCIYFSLKNIFSNFLKKYLYLLGLIIYFLGFGITYNFISIRIELALVVFFFSFSLFYKKKFFKGILFLILAIYLHNSIFILVPSILFIIFKKNVFNKKVYLLILLIMPLLFVLGSWSIVYQVIYSNIDFLSTISLFDRFTLYYYSLSLNPSFQFSFLVYYLFALVFLFFMDDDIVYRMFFNLYVFGLFLLLFLYPFPFGYRIYELYLFFSFPLMFSLVTQRNRRNLIFKLLFLGIYLLFYIFVFIIACKNAGSI